MQRIVAYTLALLATLAAVSTAPAGAAPSERRMALVIGNASYQSGALTTPANDAGLIGQSLQAAGFDVVGARNLDGDSLRDAFRDFVDKVSKAGPDTVVVVYFAGYALQLEGENYLLPIDINVAGDSEVPARALRVSDCTRALAALGLRATIVVLDAARASPFSAAAGQPLAGGFAWPEAAPGMLIALNASPGTVAGRDQLGYGAYAKALAEMIREGGLSPANVFDRVRLRVNELTGGAQVPWDASQIETQLIFFERGPGAPHRADSPPRAVSMRSQPMGDLGAADAYMVALLRDTLDGYGDYLAAYSSDPMAKRVRAILAVRREAITWQRTFKANTPEAYWSYLKRYPHGPHTADARRLLARMAAALAPPPRFAMIDYDVPSPLPAELDYLERPLLAFDDPIFGFMPPPPSPIHFLEPVPPDLAALEAPPTPQGAYLLPVPVFVPVPGYINVPAYVATPPNPFIFNNIHHTVVINNTTHVVTITKPDGQVVSSTQITATGEAGGDLVGPALPPSVAPKAAPIHSQPPSSASPATTGAVSLLQGHLSPTTPLAARPPHSDQSVATPSVTTLSPPATNNKPLSNPLVAPPSQPSVENPPPVIAPLVTLSPPTPEEATLAIARPATLSHQINIPLPVPRPATRSQTGDTLGPDAGQSAAITDSIRLPIPRPAMLPPRATDNAAAKSDSSATVPRAAHPPSLTPAVDHQAPAPVIHQTPAPPPSPRSALQAPAHAPAPPTAAKPQGKTCQVVDNQQVCK